jgi:hypothetical protein
VVGTADLRTTTGLELAITARAEATSGDRAKAEKDQLNGLIHMPRVPPAPETLDALRRYAVLLDSYFRIPGTRIRFGLDALIGLIPVVGDISAPVFAGMLLLQAVRMRLPVVVQARMVLNAALDMVLGLVPVVGDLADVAWKANLRNLTLLERHARPGVAPSRSDYIFVPVCLVLLALIAIAPIALIVWLLSQRPLI